jgi:hypothetical protein
MLTWLKMRTRHKLVGARRTETENDRNRSPLIAVEVSNALPCLYSTVKNNDHARLIRDA